MKKILVTVFIILALFAFAACEDAKWEFFPGNSETTTTGTTTEEITEAGTTTEEITEAGTTTEEITEEITEETTAATAKLNTPVIAIEDNVITITGMTQDVEKTIHFYKDGEIFTSVSIISSDSYEYPISYPWEPGTYAITVKCEAEGHEASDLSNAVNYIIEEAPTLLTPVLTITDNTLHVSGMIPGVEKTIYFYRNESLFLKLPVQEGGVNLILGNWTAGTYSITVKCSAEGYEDSDISNAVEYVVSELEEETT